MTSTPRPEGPDPRQLSPRALRAEIRQGRYRGLTSGLAPGMLQGNLIILPEDAADEFEAFCHANADSLPLIERGRPGDPMLSCGDGLDIRTDVSRYRLWRQGRPVEALEDIRAVWSGDSTAFVLGCWFANESALAREGIRLRHIEMGVQGSLFRTAVPARSAGRFSGPVVASMRPFETCDVARVAEITARNPLAHGAPLHVGAPQALGIRDIAKPDFGEPLPPLAGETPIFWACGLTGQEAAISADLPLFITHEPGHMVVTDLPAEPVP